MIIPHASRDSVRLGRHGRAPGIRGYCLLLPDPVVAHLNLLEQSERTQFLADMARVGDAVLAATGAVRINYALFGNAEPALHAHVFPRRADEAPGIRTAQPWALDWQAAPQFSQAVHGELQGGSRAISSRLRPFWNWGGPIWGLRG
jgi:diadenosine tetraphosphate (Ap4A) HIT family hydrolase